MERIAAAADVSKVTLYKHFPAKEALLRHIFHAELRAAWPAIQPELARAAPGLARLARFLELQAAWCESRRDFLLPYVRYRLADQRLPAEGASSGMDRIFWQLIAQGQAAGDFRRPAGRVAGDAPAVAHLATMLRCLNAPQLSLAANLPLCSICCATVCGGAMSEGAALIGAAAAAAAPATLVGARGNSWVC
jgi:AcrR family transcriptional regulator